VAGAMAERKVGVRVVGMVASLAAQMVVPKEKK
jgi:hypothetical protein